MRRAVVLACAAVLAVAALPAATAAPPIPVPALLRIASTAAGLQAKRKPVVRVLAPRAMDARARQLLDRDYPRARQAYDERLYRALGLGDRLRGELVRASATNVRGLYDPRARVAWVRRGPSARAATLRELVHALHDQAFDLRRVVGLRRASRDAAAAAAAAVDGAAAYSLERLARAPAGRTPAADAARNRLRAFLALQASFGDAVGRRFAAILDEAGGKAAVNGSLRRLPASTEQVLHVEKYLAREAPLPVPLPASAAGFTLAGADTFGELDVRALLAVYDVPRLGRVGAGWGGGRSALYRDAAGREATALSLVWDEELDAAEWAEAVETWVDEAFDPDAPGRPPATACAATSCWEVAGRSIAFARQGRATALVLGPAAAEAAAVAQALARTTSPST